MKDDVEYEGLKKLLKRDYFLITKGRFWSFLGGGVGILFLTSFLSYNAVMNVVADETGEGARLTIGKLLTDAEKDVELIRSQAVAAERQLAALSLELEKARNLSEGLAKVDSLENGVKRMATNLRKNDERLRIIQGQADSLGNSVASLGSKAIMVGNMVSFAWPVQAGDCIFANGKGSGNTVVTQSCNGAKGHMEFKIRRQ